MGAAVGPKSGGAKSDINVTPLIDIVLVLLIVFIVMVPGLTKAAKVTVPQVVVGPPPTTPPTEVPIVITITEEGKFMLQSDVVEVADLAEKVLPAVKLQPMNLRKITLKVDEEVKYQLAVDVLDQIRLASDKAKKDTLADPRFNGNPGDDIKILISMKKRTSI